MLLIQSCQLVVPEYTDANDNEVIVRMALRHNWRFLLAAKSLFILFWLERVLFSCRVVVVANIGMERVR